MKIIYVHHAERKISKNHNDLLSKQLEDITENGIKEADLLAEKIKNKNIKAIYTSPYLRCKHTAEIINKHINAPIIDEERFNEMKREEQWEDLLRRNIEAIDDIIKTYNEEDEIICVTSGVNFTAFICYFYKIEPSNEVAWAQALTCSPISFVTNNSKVD